MPNIFKFHSVIGLLLFVGTIKAVEVNDLYLVKWSVAEQSKTALWKASLAGLKEVLIRKSGSQIILDSYEVQQAYRRVTSYLQQYEYARQDATNSQYPYVISLYFEPRLIDGIIKDAKMPLWGSNRPVTILWIAVEENFQRRILSDTLGKTNIQNANTDGDSIHENLSQSIQTNAVRRGLPVISPLMDLEDELLVSISDIWGRFPSTILQASQRYSADSVLIGRIKKEGEQWTGDFTYINQPIQTSYQVFADDAQQVIAQMTDKLAELLCSKYCVIEESGQKNQVLMNISGINNFKNFKEVEDYLNSLSGIKTVNVMNINQYNVLFELTLLGQIESVIEGIRLSQTLQVEEAPKNLSQPENETTDNLSDEMPVQLLDPKQSENIDVELITDGKETKSVDENTDTGEGNEYDKLQILYYRWFG